ncbi:MAG: class I SAM-dependent methyltransferase [DPANN group archaeon]|nr:class I SAM-dependent methyltransferase [DPANN group archaeon]
MVVDSSTKSNIKATYDKISKHFDATRGYMWEECKTFINAAKESSIFLDIGCGNGRNSLYACQKGFKVLASDISKGQLNIIKSKAKATKQDISLIQCDAISLPLKSESFDCVMFIATIHHLPTKKERLKSLIEIKNILKPDGRALISAWARDQPKFKDLKTKDGDVILKWDGKYDRFYHLFDDSELEYLCKKADLAVFSAFKSHGNNYVEVFKRY